MSRANTTASEAMRVLIRSAVEWNAVRVDSKKIIDAAVDALVAGLDSLALRELAGASPQDDNQAVSDLLSLTLMQLAFPVPAAGSKAAAQLLLAYLCDDFLVGRSSARSVTRWAHWHFDHLLNEPSDPLVDLDDLFDDDDTYENSPEGTAEATKRALAFLASINRPELFESKA
jgi:hypothetical protein